MTVSRLHVRNHGHRPSSATAKYLNGAKVPHLFLISSASKWNDPTNQPWLMALRWAPNYVQEAGIEVRFARAKNPNARFAILYQNDDAGKDYLRGGSPQRPTARAV
jgi:ABC-type branched-subunit amino acid transport system substrate-binding protein